MGGTSMLRAALGAATVSLTLGLGAARLNADEAPSAEQPAFVRPKFQVLRQNEDWSGLKGVDRTATGDWFDRLKFIPLSDDESIWLSLGGEARIRWEIWDGFGFNPSNATARDDFALYRVLLHADLHLGENLRVFAEGKAALEDDRSLAGGHRTLDRDELDLQQLFVDVTIPLADDGKLTIRAGRQMLLLGNQRLVSPLPWSNTMRAWDGVNLMYEGHGWKVQGFWTQYVQIQKYDFNEPDNQTKFWGIYATGTPAGLGLPIPENCTLLGKAKLDLYYLGLQRTDPVTFNGTTGSEDRHTLGGRVWGPLGDTGFDYEVEGAWQFGSLGQQDINAWMLATQVGYTLADCPAQPRVFVGFDYASGDEKTGGDVETFNQLFPLGHKYLGYADFIGRQNVMDLSFGLDVKPLPKWTVGVHQHFFYRATDTDAVYNAGGGITRASPASAAHYVGNELDLTVKYAACRNFDVLAGYSRFFAGDFINQTGLNDDIDFGYLEFTFRF